ncbi:hypothetical protein ACH5RR_011693 [Cinchona calisaya]|uniref:Uncharacterized protein n=1 Tax=Cinchona calisaya TaxID=153742 RepID=A0ABD3A5Q4_9GENT
MAGTSSSLQYNFYSSLDPKSLLLSQFSNSDQPQMLQLTTTESYFMERGPRYKDYAALREARLRMKSMKQPILEEEEEGFILTPPKKQVKFQGNFATPPKRPKGSSVLTQSVPDFSSALRKENRKPPPAALPPMMDKSLTPPLRSKSGNGGRFDGIMGKLGGSKSLNSGEKSSGGLTARKSYASMEEFRGLASAARNAINGENRGGGGRTGRGVGKTVLGYRQF